MTLSKQKIWTCLVLYILPSTYLFHFLIYILIKDILCM